MDNAFVRPSRGLELPQAPNLLSNRCLAAGVASHGAYVGL